jgi:hypothetical protein
MFVTAGDKSRPDRQPQLHARQLLSLRSVVPPRQARDEQEIALATAASLPGDAIFRFQTDSGGFLGASFRHRNF